MQYLDDEWRGMETCKSLSVSCSAMPRACDQPAPTSCLVHLHPDFMLQPRQSRKALAAAGHIKSPALQQAQQATPHKPWHMHSSADPQAPSGQRRRLRGRGATEPRPGLNGRRCGRRRDHMVPEASGVYLVAQRAHAARRLRPARRHLGNSSRRRSAMQQVGGVARRVAPAAVPV